MGSAIFQDLVHTAGSDTGAGHRRHRFWRLQNWRRAIRKDQHGRAKVDVTDIDELSSILEKYDAVVNATWYENNLHVMRACLKAGCHYNDLGGLFHMTRKQLLLNEEAKSRGISAIVGGGESPGITNVMCALTAEGMTGVESVKIYRRSKRTGQKPGTRLSVFDFHRD